MHSEANSGRYCVPESTHSSSDADQTCRQGLGNAVAFREILAHMWVSLE